MNTTFVRYAAAAVVLTAGGVITAACGDESTTYQTETVSFARGPNPALRLNINANEHEALQRVPGRGQAVRRNINVNEHKAWRQVPAPSESTPLETRAYPYAGRL